MCPDTVHKVGGIGKNGGKKNVNDDSVSEFSDPSFGDPAIFRLLGLGFGFYVHCF